MSINSFVKRPIHDIVFMLVNHIKEHYMFLNERETEMLERIIKMYIDNEEKHFHESLEIGESSEDRHIYLDLYSLSQALEERN